MPTIDEEKKIMTTNELSMAVIGHVDAGKSSLTGRLLFECKAIDERTLAKLKAEAERIGKGTFYLAHTMDTIKAEQYRGITIVSNTKQFITPSKKRKVTIIDAPGHRNFISNMITGAAQCNVALLVISAVPSEFRAGIAPTGQTLEHTLLINALGVNQMIIAVNKMDAESVNFSQEKYNEIVEELKKQIKKLGGKLANCSFVPISGYTNVNIVSKDTEKMKWYEGKCLMDIIEDLPYVTHDLTAPFRMSITNYYKVSGAGEIAAGKIYTGVLKIGDAIEIAPQEGKAQIKTIEKFHKGAEIAYPDDSIGIALKAKVPANFKLKKGDVIGAIGTGLQKVQRFEALVALTGSFKNEIQLGFKPVISCHTAKVASTLVKLKSIKEKKTNREVVEERNFLKPGDRFLGEFQPEKGALVIEADKKFKILTRFVMRNSNDTIAVGQCKKITNEAYEADYRPEKKGGKKDEKKEKKEGAAKKKK